LFECPRCRTKISLMYILLLSALLVSTVTLGVVEPTSSEIKAAETRSLNPKLFGQEDVLEIIVDQINETRFTWFDSFFVDTIGPRPYNFTSNLQAAEFIADQLNLTGSMFATYQWFSYAGEEIANVIGALPSADPSNQSKIVVGAHFDTVSNSPGADDNGSGIALLLEVATVLSQFRFGCTIEFVAFNAEEKGRWGSKYYTQQALQAGEDILLTINIDMCIWDNPSAPSNEKLWIVYNGTVPYEDCEQFADLTLETSYTYVTAPIQKISSTNDTYFPVKNWRRSDQTSFWDVGIPALWIFEFNGFQNPYYHSPNDSMDAEGYNFTLGAQAAQVVAATIAKLARVRTCSVLHDVSVTNIIASRTIVGQGFALKINVTLVNDGNITESCNLTAYANTTVVDTFTGITLTRRNSTIVTFVWNITGIRNGNYTLSAYAWPVLNETDTADNTLTDGWVVITIAGDADVNGLVDMWDFYTWREYFGKHKGEWPPNLNPDIDCNELVEMPDFYVWQEHWGEKE